MESQLPDPALNRQNLRFDTPWPHVVCIRCSDHPALHWNFWTRMSAIIVLTGSFAQKTDALQIHMPNHLKPIYSVQSCTFMIFNL